MWLIGGIAMRPLIHMFENSPIFSIRGRMSSAAKPDLYIRSGAEVAEYDAEICPFDRGRFCSEKISAYSR